MIFDQYIDQKGVYPVRYNTSNQSVFRLLFAAPGLRPGPFDCRATQRSEKPRVILKSKGRHQGLLLQKPGAAIVLVTFVGRIFWGSIVFGNTWGTT